MQWRKHESLLQICLEKYINMHLHYHCDSVSFQYDNKIKQNSINSSNLESGNIMCKPLQGCSTRNVTKAFWDKKSVEEKFMPEIICIFYFLDTKATYSYTYY